MRNELQGKKRKKDKHIGAPQYIRQMLTAIKEETFKKRKKKKEEIDHNTIIVGDFNTSLTPMDRSSRQKINKETQALSDTIDQVHLTDIYRAFHSKTADYTFFSNANGTFSRIDHILGHKSNLSKFKNIKSYEASFPTTML